MPLIEIRLNGDPYQVDAEATVADLVRKLDLPADRVAVELDRWIVPRADWSGRSLAAGAAVEIVQLVGGG